MTREERSQLSAAIRRAIETSELSRYEIAKRSDVDESSISRFMAGTRSLSLDSIEKLAPVLGLALSAKKKKRR